MKRFVSWWLVAVLAVYPLVPVSAQAADDEDDDGQEQTVTRGGDSGEVKLDGYAEYWRNGILIVDGQRVVASGAVELKGDKKVRSFGHDRLSVFGIATADELTLVRPVARALIARDALRAQVTELEARLGSLRAVLPEQKDVGDLLIEYVRALRGRRG